MLLAIWRVGRLSRYVYILAPATFPVEDSFLSALHPILTVAHMGWIPEFEDGMCLETPQLARLGGPLLLTASQPEPCIGAELGLPLQRKNGKMRQEEPGSKVQQRGCLGARKIFRPALASAEDEPEAEEGLELRDSCKSPGWTLVTL